MINRETLIQFIKFSLIGILNTAVHYGVFFILFRYGKVYYLLSSGIGYFMGILNSFYCNRKWTFNEKRNEQKSKEFCKFFIVNLASLGVNLLSLKCFVQFFYVAPEIGQIFAICFSMGVNFLGNKLWTFKTSRIRPLLES